MKHPRLLLVFVIAALAVLLALGTWQVQRLAWKQALLTQLHAAIAAPPQPYEIWLREGGDRVGESDASYAEAQCYSAASEYDPVLATGSFDHAHEKHVWSVRRGRAGYLIFTPLQPFGGGPAVFVNRGFIEGPPNDASHLAFARPEGVVTVSGIIRRPDCSPAPPPDEKRGIWYTANMETMVVCRSGQYDCTHYIEADASQDVAGGPAGRDPRELLAAIPNSHLGYAITWYGLALALVAVYGFFLYDTRRKSKEGDE